jgi:hypothetical protein
MIVDVLDVATLESILWLGIVVVPLPVVLFGSVVVLILLPRLRAGMLRSRLSQVLGAICLIMAVILGADVGRDPPVLSGQEKSFLIMGTRSQRPSFVSPERHPIHRRHPC